MVTWGKVCVRSGSADGVVPVSQKDARLDLNLDIPDARPLRLGKSPDVLLRLLDVGDCLRRHLGDGLLDLRLGQLERLGAPFVELLRVGTDGLVAVGADVVDDALHDLGHLHRRGRIVGLGDGGGLEAAGYHFRVVKRCHGRLRWSLCDGS
ncbi:hypothetical protein GE09DRAFT_549829 [Coniochaeta sp. 2T2.1]|nr:hypothetical protein GE09DRAFT_549829 [Coniochaeta sp. 2T2.1]